MRDLFAQDFANTLRLSNEDSSIHWRDTGHITVIKTQLYLDFPAFNKFVGFYVPSTDPTDPSRTVEACLKLLQANAVQQALDDMPKKTPVLALLGQTVSIQDLAFSGRVLIYYEDLLSTTQQADLIRAFADKHYALGLMGPNDLAKAIIAWHHLHDPNREP
jgi:hypothetical protein